MSEHIDRASASRSGLCPQWTVYDMRMDTPLYEETVRHTGTLPDPEGNLAPDVLAETRLIARSMVVTALLRSFGPEAVRALGIRPHLQLGRVRSWSFEEVTPPELEGTGPIMRPGLTQTVEFTVDSRGRPHDPANGRFVPATRLDKEN